MNRASGRKYNELRPVKVTKNYLTHLASSILIEYGNTKVLCCVSIDNKVPVFAHNNKSGWITAEYAMMPCAASSRVLREDYQSARSIEIKRLIGRSIRASVDLTQLAGYRIILDCDVLQADGGTRTAAITGSYIALNAALMQYQAQNIITHNINIQPIAAVSVGIRADQELLLDLDYQEDSNCMLDMNVVMNSAGEIIEIQASAEKKAITVLQCNQLLELAWTGIQQLLLAIK